jgi:ubiquinone/menaquinone biosynthesis C-methylase UbiE
MRLNVWTAYRVGLRTKTGGDGSLRAVLSQLARNVHRPARFSWTLRPMDFLRYREFDFALRALSRLPAPRRVLDLSSPKLLPLTIAANRPDAQCVATDILPREVEWVQRKAGELGLTNLRCEVQDARRLDFPSNSFDLVTSISVFEHIAPEDGGDVPAISEMARVLRPGGTAIITVPFSWEYFADYQVGDVYERRGDGTPMFFQRFYDEPLLRRNFVEGPGLDLQQLRFVEERYYFSDPRRRVAHLFNNSPTQNLLFGPLFPLLSHVFLSSPRPLQACRKPYIACVELRKPVNQEQPCLC